MGRLKEFGRLDIKPQKQTDEERQKDKLGEGKDVWSGEKEKKLLDYYFLHIK